MPKAEAGTGLTPGIADILANWDQVLQSLDRVQAYTAARANETATRLVDTCRSERPALYGESAEAAQWQWQAKQKSPKRREVQGHQRPGSDQELLADDSRAPDDRSEKYPAKADHLELLLERLDQRLTREARQQCLRDVLHCWREVYSERRKQDSHQEGKAWMDQVTTTLRTERETVLRLRAQRQERCGAALRSWQEVQSRLLISWVFGVWSAALEDTKACARESLAEQKALLCQDKELQKLHCELESSQAAKDAAEALAARRSQALAAADEAVEAARVRADGFEATAEKATADLRAAESQLGSTEERLRRAEADLSAAQHACHVAQEQKAAAEREILQLRSASSRESASESHRLLTDLTIKLAQAEADTSEARTQASQSNAEMQHLKAAFADTRRELEIVYSILSHSEGVHQNTLQHLKGTIRDRELAMAHLRHLLERLRQPPAPVQEDEGLKKQLAADTPSASTPGIQSCLSLPSLSSVSSPQSVQTVKSKPTAKEIEDRKKRWTTNWH